MIWQLVRRQHGVIARWQLLELGMSGNAIKVRIGNGRLHPVFRGVYAVGRPQVAQEGWWMAAVLACGPRAALSHRSAGALWGIVRPNGILEVSVPLSQRHNRRGIRVHRRAPDRRRGHVAPRHPRN